jgi:hypothetical protein
MDGPPVRFQRTPIRGVFVRGTNNFQPEFEVSSMIRSTLTFVTRMFLINAVFVNLAYGQTMILSTSSSDYQVSTTFGGVEFFAIDIEIDAPLAPGIYTDPDIVSVIYQVTGVLEPGTPSGFPMFDLQRKMTGAEFYAQGSSLRFEIAQSAVLSDGVQAAELVGNAPILIFDGREVDNGRFHPAILELRADGTGRIQNSNNVPTQNPLVEVNFGEEYITDLTFDPGNTTLLIETPDPVADSGSAISFPALVALMLMSIWRKSRSRPGAGAASAMAESGS